MGRLFLSLWVENKPILAHRPGGLSIWTACRDTSRQVLKGQKLFRLVGGASGQNPGRLFLLVLLLHPKKCEKLKAVFPAGLA
jgi:hypothetical protein